jgi:hypothetical protein
MGVPCWLVQKIVLDKEGSGLRRLLRDRRFDAIGRVFGAFVRIPKGVDPMASIFRDFLKDRGEPRASLHAVALGCAWLPRRARDL